MKSEGDGRSSTVQSQQQRVQKNGSCGSFLSIEVISALMRGEAPEVLAKFVAAQVPLQESTDEA